MPPIPESPVSPQAFIEEILPALFVQARAEALATPEGQAVSSEDIDFKLGVVLSGEEGGAWTLHFDKAELQITSERVADCQLTILQSVVDWRAALWEGRPALVADGVTALREKGFSGLRASHGSGASPGNPAALCELENLPGRIDATVADAAGLDWSVGVQIGPGPISQAPAATIRIGATEADALRTGALHPLEALMTGQLRLEGDLGLVIQLQAIAMAASMAPPSNP